MNTINKMTEELNLPESLMKTAMLQQELEHRMTRIDAVKTYTKATLWVMASVFFVIVVGYENFAGASVISIGRFREDFGFYSNGAWALEASWQSAITGGPQASFVAGLFAGSHSSDIFGRRPVIQLCLVLLIPCVVLQVISTSIQVFFAGKFTAAFFLGGLLAVNNTYIGEVSPLAIRGMATSAVNLALTFAHLVVLIVVGQTSSLDSRWSYRSIMISQFILMGFSLIICPFMPESPYWLVSGEKDEKALNELRRLYSSQQMVESQFAIIKVTVTESKKTNAEESSYSELFKGTNLRRTAIASFCFFMQCMSGIPFVSSYVTYYYELVGYDEKTAFNISIGGITLAVGGVITSFFIADRFGRRPLLIFGVAAVTIVNLLIAVLGSQKGNKSAIEASAAFMSMYFFFYNISLGALAYTIAVEAPTNRLRAKTVAFSTSINNAGQCVWQFVIPYMFNESEANMGSKINYIFAGCSLAALFVFYFKLPEFSHRSFEELDELFAARVPARKFKNYICQAQAASEREFEMTKDTVETSSYSQKCDSE